LKITSIFLVLTLAPSAWAGAILQPQLYGGGLNISDFGPIGQTFMAEDAQVSIGLYVSPASAQPTTQLTYSLLTGAGTGGTLLDTESMTLPGDFNGYADMSFSSIRLTPGQTYSVLASDNNGGLLLDYNLLRNYPGGPPIPGRIDYTGGEMIENGQLQLDWDATFRIEPIPEPGAWALFVMGGFGLFARFRFMKHSRRVRR
jgi:hypothetical protein